MIATAASGTVLGGSLAPRVTCEGESPMPATPPLAGKDIRGDVSIAGAARATRSSVHVPCGADSGGCARAMAPTPAEWRLPSGLEVIAGTSPPASENPAGGSGDAASPLSTGAL